ncbi:MAG TPA: hypothetical protein ENF79_00605, partial [Nitrososphaeria archaeon]|nr:hypothetical protein [Nitrososphaeria archaeon]
MSPLLPVLVLLGAAVIIVLVDPLMRGAGAREGGGVIAGIAFFLSLILLASQASAGNQASIYTIFGPESPL